MVINMIKVLSRHFRSKNQLLYFTKLNEIHDTFNMIASLANYQPKKRFKKKCLSNEVENEIGSSPTNTNLFSWRY